MTVATAPVRCRHCASTLDLIDDADVCRWCVRIITAMVACNPPPSETEAVALVIHVVTHTVASPGCPYCGRTA